MIDVFNAVCSTFLTTMLLSLSVMFCTRIDKDESAAFWGALIATVCIAGLSLNQTLMVWGIVSFSSDLAPFLRLIAAISLVQFVVEYRKVDIVRRKKT